MPKPKPKPLQVTSQSSEVSTSPVSPTGDRRQGGKGSRSSNACEACKRRKTKCSGTTPCTACVAQNIECVIDTTRDLRRRTAIQRIAKESTPYQHTLEKILEWARDNDTTRLQEFVAYAKSMPSTESAAFALKENLESGRTLTENVPLKAGSSTYQDRQISSRSVMAVSSLTSPTDTESNVPDDAKVIQRLSWHPCLQIRPGPRIVVDVSSGLITGDHIVQFDPDPTAPAHPNQLQMGTELRLCSLIYEQADADFRLASGINVHRLRVPIHLIQPLTVVEDSVLCRVYTDFLRGARQMIDNGSFPLDLLGGPGVNVDLFLRARRDDDRYTACTWACEVVSHIGEFDLFMRMAWAMLLTLSMRWLLVPTFDTYNDVPEMMRPVCAQRLIPHVASIDTCPLPLLREALIYHYRDWVTALARAKCSVNWTGTRDEAVIQDAATGRTRLSDRFCEHAARFENWTVTERIFDEFPELEGRMHVVPDPSLPSRTTTTTTTNTSEGESEFVDGP